MISALYNYDLCSDPVRGILQVITATICLLCLLIGG